MDKILFRSKGRFDNNSPWIHVLGCIYLGRLLLCSLWQYSSIFPEVHRKPALEVFLTKAWTAGQLWVGVNPELLRSWFASPRFNSFCTFFLDSVILFLRRRRRAVQGVLLGIDRLSRSYPTALYYVRLWRSSRRKCRGSSGAGRGPAAQLGMGNWVLCVIDMQSLKH